MFDMLPKTVLGPHHLRGATINRNSLQAAGLVAAWQPNVFPGGGTLYDRAGVNNGTISGPTWSAGLMGHSLITDGSADYRVTIPSSTRFDGATGTIAISISTDGTWGVDGGSAGGGAQGYAALVCRANADGSSGCMLLISSGGIPQFIAKDVWSVTRITLVATSDLRDSMPHTIVVSFDRANGAACALFVDGRQEDTDTNSAAWAFNSQAILLADSLDSWWEEFGGQIGECRWYNRALSAAEIAAIYANPYDLWQPTLQIPMDDDYAVGGNPHWYYDLLSRRRAG